MFNPKHLAVIRELINHPINEAALSVAGIVVERLGLEADLGVRRQNRAGTDAFVRFSHL